jgi:hypothetical protein
LKEKKINAFVPVLQVPEYIPVPGMKAMRATLEKIVLSKY